MRSEVSKMKGGRSSLGVVEYMRERALCKRRMGKTSAADVYRATAAQFYRFLDGRKCRLSGLNATMVSDFRGFLQNKGLKTNTVNSYLSSLRAVYHEACHEGLVRVRESPFEGMKLRREITRKRAIPSSSIQRVVTLPDKDLSPEQRLAADVATFCFLACGMPFVDVVHLTRENIQGDVLVYQRHKTNVQIRVELTSGMRAILRKYVDPDSPYLFPYLSETTTPTYYKYCLRKYNAHLKAIGQRIGLASPLTSYVIRHSWASEALRRHVPLSLISQALGHTSEKTTRIYLMDLDVSELGKANRKVTGRIDQLVEKRERKKGAYLRNKCME